MATITKFEDLETWQLARQLADKVFQLTKKNDFAKDFGLIKQIRNSSGSVMDNIAEGFGRGGNKEFANFLCYSTGSCCEVQSQLYRAMDWKYITNDEFEETLLYAPQEQAIVFASLLEQDLTGFDSSTHDFEMIVLEDGHGTDTQVTSYYFYVEIE